MHYYQFNIGDYMRDTQHLDELEDLTYRRLLDLCYLSEAPLPLDVKEVARRIRMRSECERIANVLREFFTETEEGYINPRASASIDAYKQKGEKARASAKARWNKNNDLPDANALRTECEKDADGMLTNNHKPITNNQKVKTKDTVAAAPKKSAVDELDWWVIDLSEDHIKAVKAIRAKHGAKGKITQRVINTLADEFAKARAAGMTDDQIINEWDTRGWIAVKAEWLLRDSGNRQGFTQAKAPTPIQMMQDQYRHNVANGGLVIDPDEPF